MVDVFSRSKRSDVMSKIKSRDTKFEVLVRKCLFINGLRYRKNVRQLLGTPDKVLPKYNTGIFVHGCFWDFHQECKIGTLPDSNKEFGKENWKIM